MKLAGDGGLREFDWVGVVGFMQEMERTRNLVSVIDHQAIMAAERLDLASVLCQGSMRRVLASVLSLSKSEAARRVRAARRSDRGCRCWVKLWSRCGRCWPPPSRLVR